MTHVEDFPEAFRVITVPAKMLSERHRIRSGPSKICAQVVNPKRLWAQAGEQCVAGRGANSLIAVRPLKEHPAGCQSIQSGRLRLLVPVTSEHRLKIVDTNQQHIRTLRIRGSGTV
jgi:hypothetical protein